MALPEFQRGFVWNREQVRGLFHSLYRQHPVGGLLVWATEASTPHRGDGSLAPGIVKLLLDGQHRMSGSSHAGPGIVKHALDVERPDPLGSQVRDRHCCRLPPQAGTAGTPDVGPQPGDHDIVVTYVVNVVSVIQ